MGSRMGMIGGLLLVLAITGVVAPRPAQDEPSPTMTPTFLPSPPPPPTVPAAPDISGTWVVTRSWFRRCPRCSEPVIRGTTWVITQVGHELRVDRGLRGTIEGYDIQLEGIESDGFNRFDFYYSRLYLTPDGLRITGEFVGSETVHNPCGLSPPIVTCFASGGYFHAVRRSPVPTFPPPPPPEPTATASPTSTPVPTRTPTPTTTSPSAPATPSPTVPAVSPATIRDRYLPLIIRLPSIRGF